MADTKIATLNSVHIFLTTIFLSHSESGSAFCFNPTFLRHNPRPRIIKEAPQCLS